MKKILLYTLAIASLLAVSCQKDAYQPGTPDKEDCYNVYFPEQEFSGTVELDGTVDGYDFQIELKREKTEGDISVPLKVTCGSNPDVVTITTAEFADGDEDATATLSFHNPAIMEEYRIVISIVGDEYAPKYSQSLILANNTLSIDAVYAKWNTLCEGLFYDQFWFTDDAGTPIPASAVLQQNDTYPEQYRLQSPEFPDLKFTTKGDLITPEVGAPYYEISIPQQMLEPSISLTWSDYPTYSGQRLNVSKMTETYSISAVLVYYVGGSPYTMGQAAFIPSMPE